MEELDNRQMARVHEILAAWQRGERPAELSDVGDAALTGASAEDSPEQELSLP